MFLASFAAIMGPMNYVYHLLSTPRLPFTAAYFGSITLTLVFALKVCLELFCSSTNTNRPVASQYNSHLVLCSRPACLFDLVLDQLLPYGIYWSAFCHIVWSETGDSLDDGLENNLILEDQASLELVLSLNSLSCSSDIAIFSAYQLSASCNISNKWRKIVCIWEKDTRPFWIMKNTLCVQALLLLKFEPLLKEHHFVNSGAASRVLAQVYKVTEGSRWQSSKQTHKLLKHEQWATTRFSPKLDT